MKAFCIVEKMTALSSLTPCVNGHHAICLWRILKSEYFVYSLCMVRIDKIWWLGVYRWTWDKQVPGSDLAHCAIETLLRRVDLQWTCFRLATKRRLVQSHSLWGVFIENAIDTPEMTMTMMIRSAVQATEAGQPQYWEIKTAWTGRQNDAYRHCTNLKYYSFYCLL